MAGRGNRRLRGQGHTSNPDRPNSFGTRNQSDKICRQFQRGNCTYGSTCKFSHDPARASGSEPDPTTDGSARKRYLDWKKILRRNFIGVRSQRGPEEILQLWAGAIGILDSGNTGDQQFLVRDLVDDNLDGHGFILATIDTTGHDSNRHIPVYVEPFFKVITHPSLLDCLSVDSFVGTMYATFGGPNGDRAIGFLESVCHCMINSFEQNSNNQTLVTPDMVKLLLSALYQLLYRVRRARFHDDLTALLGSLYELVHKMTKICSKADVEALDNRIEIMRNVVASALRGLVPPTVPEESVPRTSTRLAQSTFPMDMEIPGGRHDNDLAEISEIQILPTQGEIVSDYSEYLPSTNFAQPHFIADPTLRYIDSTFRLLRHDIFGSVKDVLRDLLRQGGPNPKLSNKDTRAHIYMTSHIQHVFVNRRNELEATVSFSVPPQLRKKSLAEQSRWWKDSNRLEVGTLVCFLTSEGSRKRLLFLEVTVKCSSQEQEKQESTLVSNRHPPSITVKLATCSQQELDLLGQIYSEKIPGTLVDFHGLIPATFVPILKNLQRVQREGELAFQKWILPGQNRDKGSTDIPPPAYARKLGFAYPFLSISKDRARDIKLDPNFPESLDLKELGVLTGLDRGQCQGLVAALTREYAMIQGPPGTGKSHVGVKLVQVLLAIKASANLGPIIKIIRIGGRSQATKLEGKNLRVVSGGISKTRVESQTLGQTYSDLKECMEIAGYSIKPLHQSRKGPTWKGIQHFLRRKWPAIHRQLDLIDAEGYKLVIEDPLLNWLGVKSLNYSKTEDIDEPDERLASLTRSAERNIYHLSKSERRTLTKSWLKQWCKEESASLFEAINSAKRSRENIHAVYKEINRRALIQADVVGITTTSLTRNIETLRRIGARVIIYEEVAEVIEVYIISSLMLGVEHLIQIGDHRQLRPQIQNYSLSLKSLSGKAWQLDRSQFKRRAISEPGLNPTPIRRMRPEISQLIRSVYPKLEDYKSVINVPNVIGMRENIFWLDHRRDKDTSEDNIRVKSYSNRWEGEYSSNNITLLTPYTGQLQKLRASLSKDFEIYLSERDIETLAAEGLGLDTEETPQGEEAKVIIVSLIRSNLKRKVGFLRTENRINILLSRAQHGMYLIGNSETYLNILIFVYYKPCPRIRKTCDHICPKLYGEECGLCMVEIRDVTLPYSYVKRKLICYQIYNLVSIKCDVKVDKVITKCGYILRLACFVDVTSEIFSCTKPYTEILGYSHNCGGVCGKCLKEGENGVVSFKHPTYTKKCDRPLGVCNHRCLKVRCSHLTCASTYGKHRVIDFRAISDARKSSIAVISARVFAEKTVQVVCVKNASPIVVLGCGHFFTSGSVDGLVRLDEVYTRDRSGKFDGLRDVSASLASTIPSCPDCKQPIRQFVTKRYNRVINRAVMDETCKRFLTKGRIDLEALDSRLNTLADALVAKDTTTRPISLTKAQISTRYRAFVQLAKQAAVLSKMMDTGHQPAKRLKDAIALRQKPSDDEATTVSSQLKRLTISTPRPDNQITLRARLISIRAREFVLHDKFRLLNSNAKVEETILTVQLNQLTIPFLEDCQDLIIQAKGGSLSRIVITATLAFAKISELLGWYNRTRPVRGKDETDMKRRASTGLESRDNRRNMAREFLADALHLCDQLGNCEELREKVQEMNRLFEEDRYEEITPEELASIKIAMVGGRGGIATNSGHWYNCINGHPFAIGECGMPMELAKCPECGAHIGGQNHQPVEGVSRAEHME
ncbi:hypothetical protein N7524_004754 [Penicillium chrysogenum]|nr:hypothetical protein N7524_004754 [Penicillium chrysogenum]